MRLNVDTAIQSPSGRITLVPYKEEHVPKYHQWMRSPELLRLTGSEPLNLEEEYASMRAWRDDPEKLTFIILDAEHHFMVGDVNVVTNIDVEHADLAEVDVMIAEPMARRRGFAKEALQIAMAYAAHHLAVNVFIAKILMDNKASIALFKIIGFRMVKHVPAFQELHYQFHITPANRPAVVDAVRTAWKECSYAYFMSMTSRSSAYTVGSSPKKEQL